MTTAMTATRIETTSTVAQLVPTVTAIVHAAAMHMKDQFSPNARPATLDTLVAAIHANDAMSLAVLRDALLGALPGSGFVDDELEAGALPPGDWWVVDPVEGNINHIHGMLEWCVTATLVRDGAPVLTVVDLPMTGNTYSAVRGGGAYLDGARLRPSVKTELRAALVGTGQAKPGEEHDTYRRIGESVTAMLEAALVVRVSVPATLQLIQVAAGRMDAFWQFSQVRSGLVAGALLVEESGGVVTDTHGQPWTLDSADFLAAAPGIHAAASRALSGGR
jgi:myo-inositol-1(or 4)-monophosphatase